MTIRKYEEKDLEQMIGIWNEVVLDGEAFSQEEPLDLTSGRDFFAAQTYCGVAEEDGVLYGLYILHPNNVGRCGHLCNASYAVKKGVRGKGIGRLLVEDCIRQGKKAGFGILQFNAVVASNLAALALYEKLGFTRLGTIPGGFRNKEGVYEDIIPHFIEL